jgi:hypothetical protein
MALARSTTMCASRPLRWPLLAGVNWPSMPPQVDFLHALPRGNLWGSAPAEHPVRDLIAVSAMFSGRRSLGSPRVAPVQRAAAGLTEGLRGRDQSRQRGREASARRWPQGWSIYSRSSSESPARYKPAPHPCLPLEPAKIQLTACSSCC